MRNFMVFDIGGSSVKWSVIEEEGVIKENGRLNIPETVEQFFENLASVSNEMKEKYSVCGIAISAPGAVDSEKGVIGGVTALPYIHGPNFKEILKKATSLNVELENDANCAALGECWMGAGRENNDLAFVVCGSGIGGALVKNRKIHTGIHRHSGEFGYCALNYYFDEKGMPHFKSWSQCGSTGALARNVCRLKGLKENELTGLDVFKLCSQGDDDAVKEVNKYYFNMAIGIYNIQYTFDPEVIVLGGAISEREEFLDEINKRLDVIMNGEYGLEGTIKPLIKKCVYGNDANKLGALYNYLQREKSAR